MSTVKRIKVHAKVVMDVIVVMDQDMELEDVIKNRTEFLAEPKSSSGGTVVAMNIQSVTEIPRTKIPVRDD